MFDHAWSLSNKKFYQSNLHKTDWEFYKKEYQKFLPYINNNFDFAELLSEMVGELNASHQGASFRGSFHDWKDEAFSAKSNDEMWQDSLFDEVNADDITNWRGKKF